jgi:hypothetical protein
MKNSNMTENYNLDGRYQFNTNDSNDIELEREFLNSLTRSGANIEIAK